ncbi:MAG TPA: hypothetical protein VJO16_00790 [Candidatus Acidoferrum sp.]|nr:hypothetical protein [Candidatus Acidoferrum sp.]
MRTVSSPAISHSESFGKRLRHLVIGTLFVVVLFIPKILHARRNPRSWMLFRIFLAIVGAALVIVPLGSWSSYAPALIGLTMFISAILLPPAKPEAIAGDKIYKLGALVVVNGGRFKMGEASSFAAQLFVGADQISVRNSQLHSFLEIPVSEIISAQTEESHNRWFLRVNWADKTAIFAYQGVFAEHLARVAETTIRSVMRPALPVLPQRRAAGA